jgi:hypothetical protein
MFGAGVDLDKWHGGHTAIRRRAEIWGYVIAIPEKHIREIRITHRCGALTAGSRPSTNFGNRPPEQAAFLIFWVRGNRDGRAARGSNAGPG